MTYLLDMSANIHAMLCRALYRQLLDSSGIVFTLYYLTVHNCNVTQLHDHNIM